MENTEFVVEANEMAFFKEIPEDAEGKFALISSPGQLEEQFDKPQLIKLRANIRGKALKGDENMSKKKLAHECYKAATEEPKEAPAAKKGGAKKAPKEPRVTKTSIAKDILNALKEKPAGENVITRDNLAEKVGHDKANCHTMVSILRNPKRTKEPIFSTWDKVRGEYAVWSDEATMKEKQQEIDDLVIAEKEAADHAKKEAAAAKKAEEKAQKDEAKAAEKAAQKAEEDDGEEPGEGTIDDNETTEG